MSPSARFVLALVPWFVSSCGLMFAAGRYLRTPRASSAREVGKVEQ